MDICGFVSIIAVVEVISGYMLSDAIMVYFAVCNFDESFGMSHRNDHFPSVPTRAVFPDPDEPERSYGGTPSEGNPGPVTLIRVVLPAVLMPSKKTDSPALIPPDPRSVMVTVPLAAVTGTTIHIATKSRTIAGKGILFPIVFISQPHFVKNII
jgi:hypothetical protein